MKKDELKLGGLYRIDYSSAVPFKEPLIYFGGENSDDLYLQFWNIKQNCFYTLKALEVVEYYSA